MKRPSEMQIVYVIIIAAMLGDSDAVRAAHFRGYVMTKRQSKPTIAPVSLSTALPSAVKCDDDRIERSSTRALNQFVDRASTNAPVVTHLERLQFFMLDHV